MASRSTGFASFCDTNGGDYPLFRSGHPIDFQPQAYTKDMKPFVAVRILLVIVAVAIFVVSGEADGKEEFNTHMVTDVIAKDHAQLNDKEGQESFMNPYSQTLAANVGSTACNSCRACIKSIFGVVWPWCWVIVRGGCGAGCKCCPGGTYR
ncbi:hypothetical protein FOZ62_000984 [Perkinsus olseni]|uniref:Uncharacterized protein n=1 Tax=Perkinsus olseni TaxID=32597 RepID=A0A7J6TUB1_PEROL|nr:hypothetical protein FOZ62_000984 [Perkinsus olseni]